MVAPVSPLAKGPLDAPSHHCREDTRAAERDILYYPDPAGEGRVCFKSAARSARHGPTTPAGLGPLTSGSGP